MKMLERVPSDMPSWRLLDHFRQLHLRVGKAVSLTPLSPSRYNCLKGADSLRL
jgi:hypothetical protein